MNTGLEAQTVSLLRLAEVKRRTGRGKSAIYADIKAGRMPAPVQIGPRAVAWDSRAIEKWIADRIASANGQGK